MSAGINGDRQLISFFDEGLGGERTQISSELSENGGQDGLRALNRRQSFPERLWRLATETGMDQDLFWVNGVMFGRNDDNLYYCASVLGCRLGVKSATIAHDLRGYQGSEKSKRMTKKTFQEIFGTSRSYHGQVWIVKIPSLTSRTSSFEDFRWGRPMQVDDLSLAKTKSADRPMPTSPPSDLFDLADQ
jgi:hypothetical protein